MKTIELMKKTNFKDVYEAAKKYELTLTPKERYHIAERLANDKDFRDSIINADTPADRQCEARNRAIMDEYVISCLKSYEDMIVSGAVLDILYPRAVSST